MIIPLPTYREPEPEPRVQTPAVNNDWVKWYLDCPSWKCQCGITNFGRNEFCARWECKKPRPTWYVENVYES